MRRSILVVALALASLASSAHGQPAVTFADGKLAVDVADMPWPELLDALRASTGIDLRLVGSLPETATATFGPLPVDTALRRLVGEDAGLLFVYAADPRVPSEVWILARGAGAAGGEALPPDEAEVVKGLLDERRDVRSDAVQSLVSVQEAWALEALSGVLTTDGDGEVRAAAAEALARIGSPEALSAFLPAIVDPDPSVRMRALEALVHLQREDAAAILSEMLADPEPGVREAAVNALRNLGYALERQTPGT